MSSGLLAYIKQYSLFEGVKGEAVSWRNNINQLYKNWCLVANLEQQLKTKDSINKFKCSLGVLKNAGSMINKSNQILDSFRNPEETIKVITNLAYSIDENGNPSTEILNSKQNTPLRSLKTLLNIHMFTNKTNTGKCELLVYNSLLVFFCLNKNEEEKEKIFSLLYDGLNHFLELILTNFGNKKLCNKATEKLIKFLTKIDLYDHVLELLGNDSKSIIQNNEICLFKNNKEKSNNIKNLKSLFNNLDYTNYKENCIDYWINYFYNNIINTDLDKSFTAVRGGQQFIDRCKFLKISLDEYYNINNLKDRIRDKISNFSINDFKDKESILTSDILGDLGIKTCIRPRYNQKKMWDVVYDSLKNNIQTCIINSSTMGSGKSVGSMLIPHIIKKIYKEKFAYIYTSYGDHLLGQHCDVLNFRENRGLMTPGALVIYGQDGPEFYFWYEGCNLPSARDIKRISSGSGKANRNSSQRQINRKTKAKISNIGSGRQIHKPFVYISDIQSVPELVKQLQEDNYKTILVVDEPPLSASKYLSHPDDKIMNNIMKCLTTNVDILIMMCATQPELRHMPNFNAYLNNRFDRIIDVTENKIAQSSKIMFNDKVILPHYLRNDNIYYDTIRSPLNYRFYSLNDSIKCFNKSNYVPNHELLNSDVLTLSNFQTQIGNLEFTDDQLVEYDTSIDCNMETLLEQIIINKPFETGNQILWIENIDIHIFNSNIGNLIYNRCDQIIKLFDMAITKYGQNIPKHILTKNKYGQFLRWMKQNSEFHKLEKVFKLIKEYSWRFPPMKTIEYAIIDPSINDQMLILLMNGIGIHYLKSSVYYKCVKGLRDDNLLAIYIAPLELAFGTNMVLSAVVIDPQIAETLSPDLIRQLTGRVSRGLTKNPGLILSDITTIKKFLFERSPEAELMERFLPVNV
jgi:hypothetical protein